MINALRFPVLLLGILSGVAPVVYGDISTQPLKQHVDYLCSERLQGRLTGSAGEQNAMQYAADAFRRLGLEPAGDQGSFFQFFPFHSSLVDNPSAGVQQGHNVLARLRLTPGASHSIVISAHADHLGGKRRGADDNASGVASVLEAAGELSRLHAMGKLDGQQDIVFAIWSGEEQGLLGSGYFVKQRLAASKQTSLNAEITANINLDMVGRLETHLVVQGTGSSKAWDRLIKQANKTQALPLITQRDPYLPTDSTSFYLHNVPTLNLFTGAHPEYHTPDDKPELLNYEGLTRITDFLVDLVLVLEQDKQRPDFQRVAKTAQEAGTGYRVYLGTIPDYAHADEPGVRLSGVAKNSPAERAGLQADDVVIKLAGKSIHDIYDYSRALEALSVGDSVVLMVRRGHEKLRLRIVASAR